MKRVLIFLCLSMMSLLAACNAPFVSIEIATPTPGPAALPTVSTQPPADAAPTLPVEPTTDPQTAGGGAQIDRADLNAVGEVLGRAFEARDYAALRGLMRERFSISTFNQTLFEYPADEALDQMRQSVLAAGSVPAMHYGTDVVALLSGADPLGQWGPVAQVVRAVHVMGLGPIAGDEAVLVIGRDAATGTFYWHGILLPSDGGYFKAQPLPDPLEVVETDVRYVMAREDINVRTGPGTSYAVNGQIWGGQIAEVHGMSSDRAWYRIYCTQDSSGYCWITADPALAEPTSAP